jgi:colicin import membrane protein
MKPTDKDKSKGTSFWGMFFSITLHVTIIVLVLFWGFSGTSMNGGSNGPIEVSLSGLEGGGRGGQDNKPKEAVKPLPEPKKAEPVKQPEPEKKETVKALAPEPEKKEPPNEPEKKVEVKKEEPKKEEPKKEEPKKVEEKPKEEVVKKEPEKKEVVPIEPEEKEEKPKEPEKKVEKKEVAKKPEPTEKPKKIEKKKTETAKKKNLESEKSKVLHDIQRKKVLDQLKQGSGEAPEEEIGEERRLAMADNADLPEGPGEGPGEPGARSGGGGGSSINPVLMQIYTNKVHQRISRNWRIPPGVPTDGSLVSVVFFKVDGSGRVYDVRINKSSGNSAFDQFCVDAIYKSAPLPPPPSEFAEEAKNDGVLVPFRNEPF